MAILSGPTDDDSRPLSTAPARCKRTGWATFWSRPLAIILAVAMVASSTACAALQPLVPQTEFVAATYVPADTWLFETMSFRPSGSQAVNMQTLLDAFTNQPGFADAYDLLQSSVSSSAGGQLEFEKDLLPLLDGEAAVAAVGFDADLEPRTVTLIKSHDPERLLRLTFPGAQPPIEQKGYKDATFFVAPTQREIGAAYKGWALMAETQIILQQTIDRIDDPGAGGLAGNPRFQSALQGMPADKLSYTYADLAPIVALARANVDPEDLTPDTERALDAANARGIFTLSAASDGLDARFALLREVPMAPRAFPSGNALDAFQRLPSDTLAAFGGDSLPELLTDWEQQINAASRSGAMGVPKNLNFSFSGLLSGEFAAGIRRGSIGQSASGVPEGDFVTHVNDPDAAAAELDKLDALFPPKSVETVEVGGERMKRVEVAPGQRATYGLVGDWLYLTTGDAEEVIAARTTGGLRANQRFLMVEQAIDPNGFNIFVDLEGVRVLGESLASPTDLRTYRATARPFVTPLRAIATSWNLLPNGNLTGRAFLAIRR